MSASGPWTTHARKLTEGERAASRRRAKLPGAGFTLIELLAVVLIFGFMASLVLPNLGSRASRDLRDQARRLAADLELARQRAVVLGVPHRLWLDLDAGAYRLEWEVQPAPQQDLLDAQGRPQIVLAAPAGGEAFFEPVPIEQGRMVRLQDESWFAGIETPYGFYERGAVAVRFERDGTADPTAIVLAEPGGGRLVLDILPLADAVRILDGRA